MRSVPFLLAVLLLFAGAAPVRPETSGSPTCTEHGRGVRICTELDESALSRPGRSTKVRVWVEGEPRPIQIRLHNDSPRVVRLKGGDDQIIHMGCRWHRQVRRKVTSLGPGEPRLVAKPYSAFPKQEAAAIAASLAQRLAEIEARFIARSAELSPDYPAEAVLELLDTTEAELLDVLSYQDLAALRAYVQEQFRQARADLEKSDIEPKTGDLHLPFRPRAILASVSLHLLLDKSSFAKNSSGKGASRENGEYTLARIGQMLRRLTGMAEQNDFATSLCVTSDPTIGAKFLMRPQGIRKWTIEGITVGNLAVLYRGLYAYRMSKGFKTKRCEKPDEEPCALIDLVDDPQPIFHCDLTSEACTRKPGPLPANCRDHG